MDREERKSILIKANYSCTRDAAADKKRNQLRKKALQDRHLKMARIYDLSRQEAIRNSEAPLLVAPKVRFYSTKTIALSMVIVNYLAIISALIILIVSGQFDTYTSQYIPTMRNKDNNCERNTDFKDIFKILHREVLHQTEALNKLEKALQTQSTAQSIVIIGSSGIGKSMTARLLYEHYPCPGNIQFFPHIMHKLPEEHKLYHIEYALENLSQCGHNIFIIDNLLPNEYEIVQNVNQLRTQSTKERKSKQQYCMDGDNCIVLNRHIISKCITIVFIFNLNLSLPYSILKKQNEILQNLPNATIINYQSFKRKHLSDCIRNELRLENIVISEDNFNEILDYTDIEESGCKTTRSKVLQYGKHEEKVKREQERPKEYSVKNCNN